MLIFVLLIVACTAVALAMLPHYLKKRSNTPLGRIEQKKKNIQWGLREQWRRTRALGSTEDVGDWLKRKLPVCDNDWLKKNRENLNDEQLIERFLSSYFGRPQTIDRMLKEDEEGEGDLEEQSNNAQS